jgi:hypothetical protein
METNVFRFARGVSLDTNRSQDLLTVGAGYAGHNQMLHDFGLPEENSSSHEKVYLEVNKAFVKWIKFMGIFSFLKFHNKKFIIL